ncbi:MAG: spermidine synthase [Rickettsiales bacterium]
MQPMLWLFSMLAFSVGLPFFVLSATSPLSQRWFAASAPTRQPYVLYAASNFGSFAGLLAYPALVEPHLSIAAQADLLFYGFCALLALFIAAAWKLRWAASPAAKKEMVAKEPIARSQIISWIVLAAVPSSLLYGVTTYITTDIASVPLFWVIPLALYLLTFVLIFGERTRSLETWHTLHRMGAPAMVFLTLFPLTYPMPTLLLHLLIFFAAAMVCHGRLCALKPAPTQLTAFFLWVSFGGVLGGVFNSFVAPAIFTSVIEYPLMMVISLAVAGWAAMKRPGKGDLLKILIVWVVFAGLFFLLGTDVVTAMHITQPMLLASLLFSGLLLMVMGYVLHKNHPALHTLWVAPALLVCGPLFNHVIDNRDAFAGRNVFGVSRVIWQADKNAWVFRHGTTYHGFQAVDEKLRLKPNSYYVLLGDVVRGLPRRLSEQPVAVMGMGVGTVACHGKPKQLYDFFEIDPLVDAIAHDTRYFTYLRDCAPDKIIIMGDGRLGLASSPDGKYGLIVIDVFSSDAIPMHVLTREAVALYAKKLKPGGYIAFNISNRHIDLLPVLSAIASDTGLVGMWRLAQAPEDNKLQLSSKWVVLTDDPASLPLLKAASDGWEKLPDADARFLWRDDYSNILRSIKL